MTDKPTSVTLASGEVEAWKSLAASCGISLPRGIGNGGTSIAAEAIRRIARAYQHKPEQVVAFLAPLLRESGETDFLSTSNGDQLGIALEPVEALSVGASESPLLKLPSSRTPGGEARLVVLQFEVFHGAQGQRARPISFLVRLLHGSEEMKSNGQHYLFRYTPDGKAILRDWGFSPLDHVEIVGPGAKGGISEAHQYIYQASGRWGYYWVAPGESFTLGKVGETVHYPHLPRLMLPYLESLIQPAIRTMDIFCEKCHGWQVYQEDQSPYWCSHIWFCEKCQRISTPEVRSKKMFGVDRCSHNSPHW